MNNKLSVAALLTIALLPACAHKEVFFEYKSMTDAKWGRFEPAEFCVDAPPGDPTFCIEIPFRHNEYYGFDSLKLVVAVDLPDGYSTSDTIALPVSDKNGRWTGKGVSIYSQTAVFKPSYRFYQQGKYVFKIRHEMAQNPLKGVVDIGLKITNNYKK
jgi:gliding motility-associated lipoprotein GldH